jgi:hypothetical protein
MRAKNFYKDYPDILYLFVKIDICEPNAKICQNYLDLPYLFAKMEIEQFG